MLSNYLHIWSMACVQAHTHILHIYTYIHTPQAYTTHTHAYNYITHKHKEMLILKTFHIVCILLCLYCGSGTNLVPGDTTINKQAKLHFPTVSLLFVCRNDNKKENLNGNKCQKEE